MKHLKFIILIISLTSLFISCLESGSSHFYNYKGLKESGYLSKGWIPEILPDDSYQIKEVHNLDNNHVLGAFKYRSDGFREITDSLKKVDKSELEKLLQEINTSEKPSWFNDSEILNDNELNFYRFENFILIVNQIDKQVYFVQ